MQHDHSPPTTIGDVSRYAAAFAVGLVLMGFAGLTFWQHAYMSANPQVGSISTSTAGFVVYLVMFLAGATIVFNAVVLGLSQVIYGQDTDLAPADRAT